MTESKKNTPSADRLLCVLAELYADQMGVRVVVEVSEDEDSRQL